jgi:hypothetical protein
LLTYHPSSLNPSITDTENQAISCRVSLYRPVTFQMVLIGGKRVLLMLSKIRVNVDLVGLLALLLVWRVLTLWRQANLFHSVNNRSSTAARTAIMDVMVEIYLLLMTMLLVKVSWKNQTIPTRHEIKDVNTLLLKQSSNPLDMSKCLNQTITCASLHWSWLRCLLIL